MNSIINTNMILFKTNVKPYLLTVLILFLLYLGFYGIFNRFFYATAGFYVLFGIYVIVNWLKVKYRSEPVLPTDLLMLTNTKQLLSMVTWKIVILVVVALVVGIAICIFLEKLFSHELMRFNPVIRIIFIILAIFSIAGFYNVNREGSWSNRFMTSLGYSNFTPNISMTAQSNGPLLTFLGNMHVDIMDKPSDYSPQTMKKIVNKYQNVADKINKKRPNNNLDKQTLIYVLSESFSNPSRVPNIKLNEDPTPNINKIKSENTSVLMLSSGYGGGTANMEYMTFTGLAFNQFSKSLQSPYTQLVVKQKHPLNIVNDFENSAAIHPYYSNFYDRDKVYDKFGLQSFRTLDSKGKLALKYKDTSGSSEFVNDESSYKDTLWQVNQVKGGQFISLVTMQNHMPYNMSYPDNQFKATGTATSLLLQAGTYSKGLNITDGATKTFLDKLDAIKKPITVVWYGDHLPGIYDKNSMEKYNVVQHETDYFIYSNKYALEHNYGTKKLNGSTKITDPNGFIPLALKQMKQQVTPYYALLTKVQEDIPAMAKNSVGKSENLYVNSKGKQVTYSELSKKQKQLLHDYKLVQYDLTAGKGYTRANINK
ncbi:LTA synthase family protein [Lactobacillus halodurans]|uniref:LTA synthase family protein n=2 Tax=Companilactobacillus halodurans TaxID=2584183 RepID=A0A5P0ZMN6_9LACO|nr:LTA synthase family protein [Companilactobacillus halodurans]